MGVLGTEICGLKMFTNSTCRCSAWSRISATSCARIAAAAARSFRMNGVRLEAERLGTEFLGGGALDPTIRETSDGGTPITVAEPDNPHALVFCRMGAHLG